MKKLIASSALLMSAGLVLPALAQTDYSSSTATGTTASDGINDPDLFGDPQDDDLDVGTGSNTSASVASDGSAASVMEFDESQDTTNNGSGTDTSVDGDATSSARVPSALPDTGGGGMAK